MKELKIITFSFILLICFSSIPRTSASSSYTDDQIWNKLLNRDNILIIDIRSYESYLNSHIPTAINLKFDNPINPNLVDTISSFEKDENILYCSCVGGATAQYYAEELKDLGLANVFYMSDNFRDWDFYVITGSDPGVIPSNNSSSFSTKTNNNPNGSNNPDLQFSDLLPINILLGVGVLLIIIKKKK